MGIMIGTISTGTIYEYNSQAIKTKFVIIGIPLFPVGSYYKITDNLGIPIALCRKSVWVGYSRTTLLAIGLLLVFTRGLYEYESLANLYFVLGIILTGNGILNWVHHWTLKPEEERIRAILSKAFDYNMLPDYLPLEIRVAVFKELIKKYSTQFPGSNWESEIENHHINQSNAFLLFSLSYYMFQMTNNEKYNSLLSKVDHYIKEAK